MESPSLVIFWKAAGGKSREFFEETSFVVYDWRSCVCLLGSCQSSRLIRAAITCFFVRFALGYFCIKARCFSAAEQNEQTRDVGKNWRVDFCGVGAARRKCTSIPGVTTHPGMFVCCLFVCSAVIGLGPNVDKIFVVVPFYFDGYLSRAACCHRL